MKRRLVPAAAAGRTAFLTGGASGIGAALAGKLAEGGVEVWIADRQVELAEGWYLERLSPGLSMRFAQRGLERARALSAD